MNRVLTAVAKLIRSYEAIGTGPYSHLTPEQRAAIQDYCFVGEEEMQELRFAFDSLKTDWSSIVDAS